LTQVIAGYLWANVWLTDDVVVIDLHTGNVLLRLDFSALVASVQADSYRYTRKTCRWVSAADSTRHVPWFDLL
jgi:glutamine cyclotransferase